MSKDSHSGKSGGGGSANKANNATGKNGKTISALEGLRENEKQFREALQTAKNSKAAIIEFENIMGRTDRRWWNGATWTDKKPSEATLGGTGKYKRKGIYKAKFKAPKSWGKNYDFK